MPKISVKKPSNIPPVSASDSSELLAVADSMIVALQQELDEHRKNMYIAQGRIQGVVELIRNYHERQGAAK